LGHSFVALFPGGANDAVSAAIEIRDFVSASQDRPSDNGTEELKFGIGIDTGPTMIGTIGDELNLSSSVMGRPLETARRIEVLARACPSRAVITKATWAALDAPEVLQLRPIESATLDPQSEPLELYEVIGRA
jgi:adenylate cyclase